MIETPRVRLRPWRESDRAPLAAMHSDEEVMADYGGPLTRAESDAKLDRYAVTFKTFGFSRFELERLNGAFLGYVGIMPIWPGRPVSPGVEIGWRLVRSAWGHGYASEGARAALYDGFARHSWGEVLSYTAPDNARSQAVMGRLGLPRDPHRDFVANHDTHAAWTGLVWVARPDMDWS